MRRSLVAGGLFLLALVPSGAGAEPPREWSYWWKGQTGTGPELPPPPVVPDKGLWVSADPSGEQAVSALRFDGAAQTLTLEVADARGTPAVAACRTDGAWKAVEGAGPWPARAVPDCTSGSVEAVLQDGKLVVPVAGLVRDGRLDIALFPAPGTAGTWSLALAPPGPTAVSAAPPPSLPPPAAEPTPDPAPLPAAGGSVAADPITAATPFPAAAGVVDEGVTAGVFEEPEQRRPLAAPAPAPLAADPGRRNPLAALVLLGVAAVWVARTRAAVRGQGRHPLNRQSLGRLSGTEALLEEPA